MARQISPISRLIITRSYNDSSEYLPYSARLVDEQLWMLQRTSAVPHADLRVRDRAADLLRPAGHDLDQILHLHPDHDLCGADRCLRGLFDSLSRRNVCSETG